ncbi:MAG TPA: hypothetical protein VFO69_13700 [Allosphingosinicella sp.]|nr:hypothetical protein [Allosphingosinicella sp.]
MADTDGLLRAQAVEAYEAIPSLDKHGELIRLILAEVSLLTEKYRLVRRHDVPHIKELAGLLDVFWQEVEMDLAGTRDPLLEKSEPALNFEGDARHNRAPVP